MRHRLTLLILFMVFANLSFSQVRATTESGNKVLLYDDGTWKYIEITVDAEETANATPEIAPATFSIDSSRILETEAEDIFYQPSPRLEKYFGEARGRIRCKLSCSNTQGTIRLHFGWEFPVVDGNRYFGWLKKGSTVTFTMEDGQVVELIMGNDGELKRFEKQNYSVLSNSSIPLNQAQIAVLCEQPLRNMEVGWKKNAEEYEVEQSRLVMETLPTVF